MALIVDDILMLPGKGIVWIFKQIQNAYEQEIKNEKAAIKGRLVDLYRQMEQGQVTTEQFDDAERRLLDRLDALEKADQPAQQEPGQE